MISQQWRKRDVGHLRDRIVDGLDKRGQVIGGGTCCYPFLGSNKTKWENTKYIYIKKYSEEIKNNNNMS